MPRDEYDYCPECGASVTAHEWDSDEGRFILCTDDRLTYYEEDDDG